MYKLLAFFCFLALAFAAPAPEPEPGVALAPAIYKAPLYPGAYPYPAYAAPQLAYSAPYGYPYPAAPAVYTKFY